MPPKKLSGSAFRKLKKQQEKDQVSLSGRLNSWLKPVQEEPSAPRPESELDDSDENDSRYGAASSICSAEKNANDPPSDHCSAEMKDVAEGVLCKYNPKVPNEKNIIFVFLIPTGSADSVDELCISRTTSHAEMSPRIDENGNERIIQWEETENSPVIVFEDPARWPEITENVRILIVEHGTDTFDLSESVFPSSDEERHFDTKWFYKVLKNGERVRRQWLIYSKSRNVLFCFACILFSKKGTTNAFCDLKMGFNDWKHLNPYIQRHETSSSHIDSYISWKELEKRLKLGKTVDDDFQKSIVSETEKWKAILRVVIDVILFCAKNNLALRGHSSDGIAGESGSGIFLNTLELISHYHPQLAAHMAYVNAHKHALSYFSPKIQNELIELIASNVKHEILAKIKQAKYYAIMFDCTPDSSRKEQMSQVIRYVNISDGRCCIEENFIEFIHTTEKTGEGLSEEILCKLEADGIDINDCRGQSYDNGSNMAGKYKGVQARLIAVNHLATFVPCAAHSLNLVGTHAASVSSTVMTFFSTVQQLFNFFSGSTSRWDVLMGKIGVTLKGHSDTRWSSKQRAVSALKKSISAVYSTLSEFTDHSDQNNDTILAAQTLMKQINFKFLCLLFIWEKVLNAIDKVNTSLQSKTISIDVASSMIEGLVACLRGMKEQGIQYAVQFAKEKTAEMGLEDSFPSVRGRKAKKFFDEEPGTEKNCPTSEQNFKREVDLVFDKLLLEMSKRYQAMADISSHFSFLYGKQLHDSDLEEMKKCASDFGLHYTEDVNVAELVSEIEVFMPQMKALIPDLRNAKPLDLLKCIVQYSLSEIYPNISTALRIYLTLPVTVASCERSFSKLKLIKNYLRATMGQERFNGLALLSIEHRMVANINMENIIHSFASAKARKVKL